MLLFSGSHYGSYYLQNIFPSLQQLSKTQHLLTCKVALTLTCLFPLYICLCYTYSTSSSTKHVETHLQSKTNSVRWIVLNRMFTPHHVGLVWTHEFTARLLSSVVLLFYYGLCERRITMKLMFRPHLLELCPLREVSERKHSVKHRSVCMHGALI